MFVDSSAHHVNGRPIPLAEQQRAHGCSIKHWPIEQSRWFAGASCEQRGGEAHICRTLLEEMLVETNPPCRSVGEAAH